MTAVKNYGVAPVVGGGGKSPEFLNVVALTVDVECRRSSVCDDSLLLCSSSFCSTEIENSDNYIFNKYMNKNNFLNTELFNVTIFINCRIFLHYFFFAFSDGI